MDIGSVIRKLRLERGYTQRELGVHLGVQKSAIQKMESGTVKNIKAEHIAKLCQVFGVSPSLFLDTTYDTDRAGREVKFLGEMEFLFGSLAVDLLEMYQALNNVGRIRLVEHARDMAQMDRYKR